MNNGNGQLMAALSYIQGAAEQSFAAAEIAPERYQEQLFDITTQLSAIHILLKTQAKSSTNRNKNPVKTGKALLPPCCNSAE